MRMTFASRLKYTLVLPLLVVPMLFLSQVDALELDNRSLRIDDPKVSLTTIHTFDFDITSITDVGSIAFEYCSNSPLESEPCIASSGFDISAASLNSQTGETGFGIHVNTVANRMVLTRVPVAPVPGPVQYIFGNVINPDTVGSHYVRIYTYATDDGTGPTTDFGGLAFSVNEPLSVAAYVPPVLRFCVAVTIPGADCSSAVGNNLDFGILDENVTSFGTTQMMAATNGVGGYNISLDGTTMTSGNNEIASMPSAAISRTGTQQFGLNLRNNGNPNVGANPSGVGTGSPSPGYSSPNRFQFNRGDIVASSSLSTEYNKYTSSYIVNIHPDQPAGQYSTTLTYIAFASF